MKNRYVTRALTAGITALALSGIVALPGHAAETVTIVDPDASPLTRSLFSYLDDVRGDGILFGHQHTTSYGLTFTGADGVRSDVKNMTGDHPAVFGWDTLILQGDEAPGSAGNTTDQNIAALDDYITQAHELGGINTLSAHIENFVTGGSFYDTTGDTLRAVLPGGAKNAELNAYLDDIAAAADGARDADGNLIPIIFRPWHENAGSWFWWGAAFGSPGEYKELYRYTVEYLRDLKGVSNFLYAFGPGSGFGGNAEQYLRTYPGDAFVDVFGLDAYDNTGSEAFLDGLVADLGMIADLADAKGKVSAFTEFGVTNGVGTGGSSPEQWFTKVLDAIKADPRASRSAYMQTWANFDAGQHYVPVTGDALLPDFQAYAADPFTLFAGEVTGAFDRAVDTTPAGPILHIASPADSARVATSPTTIRATVQNVDADRVYATVGDTEIDLSPGDGLWWSAPWDIPAEQLDNSTQTLEVHVVVDGVEVLTESSSVVLGPRPTFGPGVVDDFEGYGDDTALRAELVSYGANTLSLDTSGPSQALRMDYDFATQTYTGFGKQVSGDWSSFNELALWVDPDGSGNTMVLQLVAGGVSYEAYPSLEGTEPGVVTFPFVNWRPAPWDTANADRRITDADLRAVSQLNIYVNAADDGTGASSGSIVVDDIAALPGVEPPPVFSDVLPGSPNVDSIIWLHEQGLVDAYADGTFRPSRPQTRQDAATLLYRYTDSTFVPAVRKPTFRDVPKKHAAYTAVEWLAHEGLVDTGIPLFLPKAPLDRSSAAELLWRLAGSPEPAAPEAFTDVPSWHPYGTAIAWVTETGIIVPASATRYGVLTVVTRGDFAGYLDRYDHRPSPLEPVVLSDFTDGAQGWGPVGEGTATGSDGALTIAAASPDGGWFGVAPAVADWTGRTELRFDVVSTTGFDTKAALQVGSSWTWCETAQVGWIAGPTADVVVDLATLSAECGAQLSDVKKVNLYLNAGTHVLDDVELH
ncbi:glycosyl hydrolase [Cellulomonas fengjieae]|uniref:glycosyl hydrolase n=1 Tax=Cellulomonas fengjieae TaxID=2819978 RepID=UPI001AAE3D1B|nr:glycosyl hydrolase [Cellulomonas fengjieae]MBO3101811.1 S-layer homology domain-containing protein [Cellulomonas fengjieae]